jgi:hypothetical protein
VRKILSVATVVVATLALSACASTVAAKKAAVDHYVASLGSTKDLQVTLTGSTVGPGPRVAEVQRVLRLVTVDVTYASASGASLATSSAVKSEMTLKVGSTAFLDVREINQDLYVRADFLALDAIPGLKVSSAALVGAQLFLGDKWFEVQKGLIASYVPKTAVTKAKVTHDRALAMRLVAEVTGLVDRAPYRAAGSGAYVASGTLESILRALTPTIDSLPNHPMQLGSVRGSYVLKATSAGTVATRGAVTVTVPGRAHGNVSLNLNATFSHASATIATPTGATVITRAWIQQLKSLLGSLG